MTSHPTFFALAVLACTACVVPATNGSGVSHPEDPDPVAAAPASPAGPASEGFRPPPPESQPAPPEDCVPRPDEERDPRQDMTGLRVQAFRVLEPLVAGGSGQISVALVETTGVAHYAYPGIRAFSDDATIEDNAQLYGIGGCDVNAFTMTVTPGPDVRAGDTIELNFQAAELACKRGDYPCEGEILTVPVQVVGH